MTKYVKINGLWYEWDVENMLLLHQDYYPKTIDENSPEWINATIVEAENLHDLYLKTGYSDLLRAPRETCLWLDPEGQCWKGDCHTIDAENIV